ncbi:MAG: hypothetical protein VCA74_05200, partial [Deltaproteobacteria bacterium]
MKSTRTLLPAALALMFTIVLAGCDGFEGDSVTSSTTAQESVTLAGTSGDSFSAVTITLAVADAAQLDSSTLTISTTLAARNYALTATFHRSDGALTITIACGDGLTCTDDIDVGDSLFTYNVATAGETLDDDSDDITVSGTCASSSCSDTSATVSTTTSTTSTTTTSTSSTS